MQTSTFLGATSRTGLRLMRKLKVPIRVGVAPLPTLPVWQFQRTASTKRAEKSVPLPLPLANIGKNIYNDMLQQQRLPAAVYSALQNARKTGKKLPKDVANAVAEDMKHWAFERGAVTFTHWFSPVRGAIQGEKYDSLVDLNYKTKEIIADFSGGKLFMGETDGSSYPSGDLRATHTAAAYLAWDTSSPPFLRNDCLYIPAAYVSWTGDALDEKLPLLRAQEAINEQGLRLLRAIGEKQHKGVVSNVGWEQEFFIVSRENFLRRPDLMATNRCVIGALPAKHQQTSQQYFGRIPLRVRAFLRDMQTEMWALGCSISTLHNEVAPGQHETAPIFSLTNVAADQNMMLWDVMNELAHKHGLVAIFHEKPFAGINGSGKHNNWGLNTDDGTNLLVAGKNEAEQRRFMTFVAALARTIKLHGDVLRVGVATQSNDFRLGAHEAPPAIISLYTGHTMEKHLKNIINGGPLEGYGSGASRVIDLGARSALELEAPVEDRNRTAPFPFCGNRFEFRAVGGSQNINFPLALLNTAVADSLGHIADLIEGGKSQKEAVAQTLRENIGAVFNGNNYSAEWREEAKARGLYNLPNTPAAAAQLASPKNIALFKKAKVFTETEVLARQAIMYEQYAQTFEIEAAVLQSMLRKGILPAILRDQKDGASSVHKDYTGKRDAVYAKVFAEAENLDKAIADMPKDDNVKASEYACNVLKAQMSTTRKAVDAAESYIPKDLYPYPTYEEMLYSHHFEDARDAFSYASYAE